MHRFIVSLFALASLGFAAGCAHTPSAARMLHSSAAAPTTVQVAAADQPTDGDVVLASRREHPRSEPRPMSLRPYRTHAHLQ